MLNRLAGKLGGHVGEVTLFAGGRARLAVVHGKRTKHFAFARHDWSGPASGDTDRGCKAAVFLPQRVCRNVGDDYRLAPKHSRPARTMLWPNWAAVNHLNVILGKARRHRMLDMVAVVADQKNGADHLRRLFLDNQQQLREDFLKRRT